VTALSPHFIRPYRFGAFALVDAGRPDLSVKLLQRAFRENPTQWGFPAYLGYFAYQHGSGSKKQNDLAAARWYERAAAVPGSPPYLLRLAAVLSGKGGELEKAVTMWGQVYAAGDKYSRQKAVDGLERILPENKTARMKAAAPLYETMPKDEFEALIAELFKGYQ
jgi:tetratricopeptide (TPR) repeat protein